MFRPVSAVFLLLLTCGGNLASARTPARRVVIPSLARILDVRVGYNTMDDLERRLGPGRVYTGGHPRGAREWRVRGKGWYIDADGFDYVAGPSDRGYVIDYIRISRHSVDPGKPTPSIHLPARVLRYQGLVSLGMRRAEVLRRLCPTFGKPAVTGNKLVWHAAGYYQPNPSAVHGPWTAELRFRDGILDSIEVSG